MFLKLIDFGLSHSYYKNSEEQKDERQLPDFLKNKGR